MKGNTKHTKTYFGLIFQYHFKIFKCNLFYDEFKWYLALLELDVLHSGQHDTTFFILPDFEDALKKREHEFRLQKDEMSAKVLEYELKVD